MAEEFEFESIPINRDWKPDQWELAALIGEGRQFVIFAAEDGEGLIVGVLDEEGEKMCVPANMHFPDATIGYALLGLATGIVKTELGRNR